MEKKTVSMEALYWEIQGLMDETGIGDEDLTLSISYTGYSHVKKGEYNTVPTKEPRKCINIHIYNNLVVHSVESPTLAIEKVKNWIREKQLSKDPVDSIGDVMVEMETI